MPLYGIRGIQRYSIGPKISVGPVKQISTTPMGNLVVNISSYNDKIFICENKHCH